jgi:hypothetical protein
VRGLRRELLPLIGSAVLTAFSIAALPFSRGLFRVPRTPYDAGDAASVVPSFVLLQRADSLIPRGASVVVRTGSSDPTADTYLHRFAVALLPGRQIVPAARWGVPSEPQDLESAQYEVVVLGLPSPPRGRLLLEIPEGTLWQRDR